MRPCSSVAINKAAAKPAGTEQPYPEAVDGMAKPLQDLPVTVEDYMVAQGDDVQRKQLKYHAAFKRLKNFATEVLQKSMLLLYIHLNTFTLQPLSPNAQNVSQKGHWGTGRVEITLTAEEHLDAVAPLFAIAYEGKAPAVSQAV